MLSHRPLGLGGRRDLLEVLRLQSKLSHVHQFALQRAAIEVHPLG